MKDCVAGDQRWRGYEIDPSRICRNPEIHKQRLAIGIGIQEQHARVLFTGVRDRLAYSRGRVAVARFGARDQYYATGRGIGCASRTLGIGQNVPLNGSELLPRPGKSFSWKT